MSEPIKIQTTLTIERCVERLRENATQVGFWGRISPLTIDNPSGMRCTINGDSFQLWEAPWIPGGTAQPLYYFVGQFVATSAGTSIEGKIVPHWMCYPLFFLIAGAILENAFSASNAWGIIGLIAVAWVAFFLKKGFDNIYLGSRTHNFLMTVYGQPARPGQPN